MPAAPSRRPPALVRSAEPQRYAEQLLALAYQQLVPARRTDVDGPGRPSPFVAGSHRGPAAGTPRRLGS